MVRRTKPTDDSAVATLEMPTFEAVQKTRYAERIERYRELVKKAAGGSVTTNDMGEAGDLLASIGLPLSAWTKDVEAYRQHAEVLSAQEKAAADREDNELRAAALAVTIKRLEEELRLAKAEHYTAAHVAAMTRVGLAQRRNELSNEYPHLFREPDEAAQLRIDAARNSSKRSSGFSEGWH